MVGSLLCFLKQFLNFQAFLVQICWEGKIVVGSVLLPQIHPNSRITNTGSPMPAWQNYIYSRAACRSPMHKAANPRSGRRVPNPSRPSGYPWISGEALRGRRGGARGDRSHRAKDKSVSGIGATEQKLNSSGQHEKKYADLKNLIQKASCQKHIIIIGGDFNASIGRTND